MSKYDENKQLRCSFCGKPQSQVKRLVAGPGVYICDECVQICLDIINEGAKNEKDCQEKKPRITGFPNLKKSPTYCRNM